MTNQTSIRPQTTKGVRIFFLAFAAYATVAVALAGAGFFASIDANVFALVVVAATVSLTLSYYLIPSVRTFARAVGPYGLASFHVWRIPAAITFLYYGWNGLLPMTFVNLAGWGDMLAGVLAVVVFLLPRHALTITWFHIIGLADFFIAVGTGVTLNALDPTIMSNLLLLPVAIIPLVGVPLSGATHIAALSMLLGDKPDVQSNATTL